MTQFSATIRRKSGDTYTSLVDAADEERAKELAAQIAASGAEGDEVESVEAVPASPEGEAPAEEETSAS
jgi:hypothetical protein